MVFSHPQILWLLVPVLLIGIMTLVFDRQAGQQRTMLIALTRVLCLAAAVLALSRPLVRMPISAGVRVVILDCSATIGDEELWNIVQDLQTDIRNSPSDTMRVVAFANRAEFLDKFDYLDRPGINEIRRRLATPLFADDPKDGGSCLADALRLAGASIEAGRSGQVELHTDGLQTRGDAAAETRHLADRGIQVTVNSMKPSRCPIAQIADVRAPQTGAVGQSIPCEVTIHASSDCLAKLELLVDSQVVESSSSLSLHRGAQTVTLAMPLKRGGLNQAEIRLSSADSGITHDTAPVATWATPGKRVLVIEASGDNRTSGTLTKLLGPSASISQVETMALENPATLAGVDLLVLANTPADRVSDAAQNNIVSAAEHGMGMLLTGGPTSFGPGGWSDSQLAGILPVRLPQELERQDPSATAVFIIDTSGSMTGPRISLAKEVVRLALRRLQVQDKAGIVEFYGSKRWAAPIQSAANHLDLNRALNRLTAGGGTVILPAIEEAEFALKNVNTRTRHVVILTDGGVESGPFEMLSRRMAESGITVSTVLVGPGGHSPFLASIAQWGRGRFYHAPDRFNLPEIILHQPQTNSPPPIVQVPSKLSTRSNDDVTRGIDFASAPLLGGYVRTQAKPTADVLLQAGGDALLTRWQYGRGRVATLATDFGSTWTDQLGRWPGTGVLVSNLCRSLYAPPSDDRLAIHAINRPAGLEIQVDSMTSDESTASLPLALEIQSARGEVVRQTLIDPIRPRAWNALFRNLAPGNYTILASTQGNALRGQGGVAIPVTHELQSDEPNESLLKQIEQISKPATTSNPNANAVAYRYEELWPCMILAAMAMLLLNVFVRRRPIGAKMPARRVASLLLLLAAVSCVFASPLLQAVAAVPTTSPSTQPANAALDAGDLPRATAELEDLLKTAPQDAWTVSTLAFVHEMRGDDRSAIDLLTQAVACEKDPAKCRQLSIRLAVLQQDVRESAPTTQPALAQPPATCPSDARLPSALVAAIYGKYDIAAQLTANTSTAADPFELLLRGTSLLRINQPVAAGECFAAAAPLPKQARDRRFVLERLIAASRDSGKLNDLANQWLADPSLPADHLLPLVSVLRELSRIDDILALWKRPSADKATRDLITSSRFVAELIAATREANRLSDAQAVCRAALDAEPENDQWLIALSKILVELDRVAEVDALLLQSSTRADSPARIIRVAQTARDLGRDDLAIDIARKSASAGVTQQVAAELFCAQLEVHRGNRAESIQAMEKAATLAGTDHKLLANVAEAFEQNGNRARAIELYRQAAKGGEDVLQKLAWLLEQDNQLAESQKIWTDLWRSAGSTARRLEAQNRVLDLASRTGTIADLAAELEDRLSAGNASGQDLTLLIDIYVGARDPASASEILASFKSLAGSEREATDQLAKLYLKCGRFGQADRALRQLLLIDPEHAIDTLQEIAVLAIERGRPAEAQAALEDISRRTGTDTSTAELRAGVYEQLGLFNDAAKESRRALIVNPDQVEDWVLWAGVMNQAGQKDLAVNRLLVLAMQADGDDLFTIAVDGLLNLEAPREAMRIARRCAIARVAKDGRKLVLYELIRDLSEAMGDTPMALRAGELSLLIAGEQRTELIRELILLCKSSGQGQRSVELGRTLLALGDVVPPQVFLDIGRQLLDEGRFSEADSAFARAEEASGDDEIRRNVARMYESAGQTRLALNTLHPLIRLHPNDIDLRARSGGMHEQLGEYSDAFEHYLGALNLMLRRGTTGGVAASTAPTTGTARAGVPRQGASMTEADQFLDGLVQGLISCARTDALRTQLIDSIRQAAEQELASAEPGTKVPSVCAERAALLRRFAFALHQPDAADAFDKAVHQRFPQDQTFTARAVSSRVEWGLLDRAAQIAEALGQPVPTQVALRNSLLATSQPAASSSIDPDEAAQLLPRLLVLNQTDRARQVLSATDRRSPRKPTSIPLLLAVSLVLDDSASAEIWSGLWLSRAEARNGGKLDVADAEECVRRSWPALSTSARKSMLTRVAQWSDRASATDKPSLGLLCMRMSVLLQEPAADRVPFAQLAAAGPIANGSVLAELIGAVPETVRPAMLAKAMEPIAAQKRRALLLQLLAGCDVPINGPLLEEYMTMFEEASAGSASDRREQLAGGTWSRNRSQPEALRRIAAALLKDADDDLNTKLAAAQALATAGDQAAADKVALEAIAALTSGSKKTKFDNRTLSDAVGILSASVAENLLQHASSTPSPATSTASRLLRAMLLEQIGKHAQAFEAYQEAFYSSPGDSEIRRLFTDQLENDLRFADLIDAFTPFLKDDTVVNQPQKFRLQKAYRQLDRFDEAAAVMSKDDSPVKQLQRLQMAAEAGRSDELLPLFRSFHVDNRWERRSFAPFLIPAGGMGGLADYTTKRDDFASTRVSIYRLVAPLPWAADELQALFAASIPEANEVATLSVAIAATCTEETKLEQAISLLKSYAAHSAITSKDRALIAALMREGHPLPSALTREVDEAIILLNPSTDTDAIAAWGQSLRAAGEIERADAVNRWTTSAELLLGKSGISRARSLSADQLTLDMRVLIAAAPTPGEAIDENAEAARLARIAETDPTSAEAAIDELRENGRVPIAARPQLAALWARLAGERGDWAASKQRATSAIENWPTRIGTSTPDVRLLMPHTSTADSKAMVKTIRDILVSRAVDRPRDAQAACRGLCVLGDWCVNHALPKEAAECLDAAVKLCPDRGEHQLWIADLAREMGREVSADQTELALLKARALPLDRIATLLARVEQTTGLAAAKSLAANASKYCALRAKSEPSTAPDAK